MKTKKTKAKNDISSEVDFTMGVMIRDIEYYVYEMVSKKFPMLGEMVSDGLICDADLLEDFNSQVPFLGISFIERYKLTPEENEQFWMLEKELSKKIDNRYFRLLLGIRNDEEDEEGEEI